MCNISKLLKKKKSVLANKAQINIYVKKWTTQLSNIEQAAHEEPSVERNGLE